MTRDRIRTVLLIICFVLFAAFAVVLSRFPVNMDVTGAEKAAKWQEALYEAEQKAYAVDNPEKLTCPVMVLTTVDNGEEIFPGYVRLFTEEGEILSCYTVVTEGEKGELILDLQNISRKGRVHSHMINLTNLGNSTAWLLSPAGTEISVQEADDALPHLLLYLLRNGEDAGIYDFRMVIPVE